MAEQTHEARIATLEERTTHLVTRGDLYRALLIQTRLLGGTVARVAALGAVVLAMAVLLAASTDTSNTEREVAMPSISIIPFVEPSLAECEQFVAARSESGPVYRDVSEVSPSVLETSGMKVPSNVPTRFSLTSHGREEHGSVFSYTNPDDGGWLLIEQQKVTEDVTIPAPPGASEDIAVDGEPAFLVRGAPTIDSRKTDAGVQVMSCGWANDTATHIYFLNGDTLVSAAVLPASAVSDQELQGIAASLRAP